MKGRYLAPSFRDTSQVAGLLVVVAFMEDEVAKAVDTLVRQRQTAETSSNLQLLLTFNLYVNRIWKSVDHDGSVLCLSSFTVYFTMFVCFYVLHCHVCYCICLSFISHICEMGHVAWIKLIWFDFDRWASAG